MSLWIRDTSSVPEGGWRYPGINGFMVNAPNYNALYPAVTTHYLANNINPPSQEEVIAWLCAALFIPCVEGTTAFINNFTMGLPVKPPGGGCCK